MKSSVYVAYCLLVTTGLTYFYGEVKEHLASPEPYLRQIDRLKKNVKEEELKLLLTFYEFEEFRQHVASLLPGVIQEKGPGEKGYPYRNLASVTQKTNSDHLLTMKALSIFEKGRAEFRAGRYPQSIGFFNQIIADHTYSAHLVEAMFLKLEAHFQMREFNEAIQTMEKMVEAFPSSELTGYAMLRVGKIYEFQDRYDESIRIYQTVLKSFPDRRLAQAAREHLE